MAAEGGLKEGFQDDFHEYFKFFKLTISTQDPVSKVLLWQTKRRQHFCLDLLATPFVVTLNK